MKLTEKDIANFIEYNACIDYQCGEEYLRVDDDFKDDKLTKQILNNSESIDHLREYLNVMKDEPDAYIKLSKVYHDLRRILGDE